MKKETKVTKNGLITTTQTERLTTENNKTVMIKTKEIIVRTHQNKIDKVKPKIESSENSYNDINV